VVLEQGFHSISSVLPLNHYSTSGPIPVDVCDSSEQTAHYHVMGS
jgi:hypothetical protein